MEFDVFYPPSIFDMWFLGENLLVDFLEMGMDLCDIIVIINLIYLLSTSAFELITSFPFSGVISPC
jgi:hypothetical protein